MVGNALFDTRMHVVLVGIAFRSARVGTAKAKDA